MDSAKKTARLAGLAYLVLGIASVWGLLCIPLVRADAAALGRLIARPGFHFPLGLLSDLISQVSSVFLVLLLYRLLSPINTHRAALMAALLLVSVPFSMGITLTDVAARILMSGPEFLSAFTQAQLNGLAMVFTNLHIQGIFAVEIFWGLWLLPFGLLVLKSRFIPRGLGITLIIAGIAYIAHSLISLLFPGPQPAIYRSLTMLARAAGELPMILWLLIKGVRAVPSLEKVAPAV